MVTKHDSINRIRNKKRVFAHGLSKKFIISVQAENDLSLSIVICYLLPG